MVFFETVDWGVHVCLTCDTFLFFDVFLFLFMHCAFARTTLPGARSLEHVDVFLLLGHRLSQFASVSN